MTERTVVTLIHGTFARGADWVKDGSRLCSAIQNAFPVGVEFRRLCWSGRNTIRARAVAAERLRAEILAGTTPEPDTRHFIVAHSHGGNIALYALRDDAARERIIGVATLATPFLCARRRDLGTQGMVLFCVGFLGWAMLAGYLGRRFLWPSVGVLDPTIVGIVLFFLFTLLVFLHWQRAKGIADMLQLARLEPQRLWIARMSGDEASAGLQTGQFAGTIVARIHLLFVRANIWAEKTALNSRKTSFFRIVGGLIAVIVFWVVGRLFGADDAPAPVLWSCLIGIAIGGLIILWGLLPQAAKTAVPIAAGLVAPLAFLLPMLLVLPFGSALAVYSFLLEVSAEATPLGTWTVHTYEPVRSDAAIGGPGTPSLAHSGVYNQSDVLEGLTTWMKERAAA